MAGIRSTFENIEKFEKNEDTSGALEYCRLFQDSAFCNLAVKHNKLFVAIMIYLIYSGGDLSIFKITQLKCIDERDKQKASQIAAFIISKR